MIIFHNEERAYRYWLLHHREGFVLDGRHKPKLGHFVLHRATCSDLSPTRAPKQRWTTGARFKAVSLDRDDLLEWSTNEAHVVAKICSQCRPDQNIPAAASTPLSKLSRDVLDYVLEAALIHMEHEHPPYRLSLDDIAACFGKTSGQTALVVRRLIDGGWLTMIGKRSPRPSLRQGIVAPTLQALRSLDAFRGDSDQAIHAELQKLQSDHPSH